MNYPAWHILVAAGIFFGISGLIWCDWRIYIYWWCLCMVATSFFVWAAIP